jgi:hypothetical protein
MAGPEEFAAFWPLFLADGPYLQNLSRVADFFERFPMFDFPERSIVISTTFQRMNVLIDTAPFSLIKVTVISALAALAPVADLRDLGARGLFESILVLFLHHEQTFEKSVVFLDRFFGRPDVVELFDDVLFMTIVNFANIRPRPQFWRFLCKFLTKFGGLIEMMCDFAAVESNGMLPIFTRSLIWTYRIVYQHPPETHEECFWALWTEMLTKYHSGKLQTIGLFQGLMAEVRLSLYWALKSAAGVNPSLTCAFHVWRVLYEIDSAQLLDLLENQTECEALTVACDATLPFASPEHQTRLRRILAPPE